MGRVKLSRVTAVVLLALFGLVLAAAVTYAASTIVSHPIGLASEPADIGESLGPRQFVPPPATTTQTVTRTTTIPSPPPATSTAPPPTTTFTPAPAPTTSAPTTSRRGGDDSSGGTEPTPGSPGYTGRGDGDD